MNAQGPHHQPVHRIRLSLCSHGDPDERPDPTATTRLVHGDPRMRYYLNYLSNEFTRNYGQHFGHPQFIFLDLPRGYSLWWRARGNSINNRSGVRNGNFFLWGHENGHFRSASSFAEHIFNTMALGSPVCNCGVC